MLVASSGEVYGDTGDAAADEETPLAPVSPYAASKAAAEVACERARRVDGLDVVVARPFPHIGPGQDERFASARGRSQVARLEQEGGGALARRRPRGPARRHRTCGTSAAPTRSCSTRQFRPASTTSRRNGRCPWPRSQSGCVALARWPIDVRAGSRAPASRRRPRAARRRGQAARRDRVAGRDRRSSRSLADALDEARRART